MISRVIVVGGGASALYLSSLMKERPLILERGERACRKLLLTGGGRCNFTHLEDRDQLIRHYRGDRRLIKSLVYEHSPSEIIDHLKSLGIDSYADDTGRVYPLTNRSSDVADALMKNSNVFTNKKVIRITKKDNAFRLLTDSGDAFYSEKVVLSTGGDSYRHTGSDGNGYSLLKSLGHSITELSPALSALILKDNLSEAEGITLNLKAKVDNKSYSGSAVITKDGISGPLSENISWAFAKEKDITLSFRDDLSSIDKSSKALLKNALGLPPALIKALLGDLSEKRMIDLTKSEREFAKERLQSFKTKAIADRKSAMSTHGGIKTDELDRSTLESKIVKNLYVMGDILDIDGDTGGYSLTIAFSSAYKVYKAINAL